MGDSIEKALKYDDQQADEQAKDDGIRDNQRACGLRGMTRWHEVKEAVNKNCKDFNVRAGSRRIKLTVENSVISELDVRADIDGKTRGIHAAFEESTGKLSWSYCGKNRRGWNIEATNDDNAQFVGDRVPLNAEGIADEMLSLLIDLD